MKQLELGIYYHKSPDKMFILSFSNLWKVKVACIEKRYSSWMESYALFCYTKKYADLEAINSINTQPIKIYEDEERLMGVRYRIGRNFFLTMKSSKINAS